MSKITLTQLANLQNQTTAVNNINANSTTIQTAFDNTLSRDGTQPNQMGNIIDMNGNQIINLPTPATGSSPLRLQDASTLNGGGTIATIPAGGNTGDALVKNSNANYDLKWTADSSTIVAGTNIVVTGTSPATVATTTTPTFTTVNTATIPTVVDTLVGRNTTDTLTNKTLTTPALSSPALSGTVTGNNTVPLSILQQSAAGTVLGNPTGSTANVTSTISPVLGVAGSSVGTVGFNNATSGTVTVAPPTGALGTVTNTLQAATDTFVYKATTDTLTNKTIDTAGPNTLKVGGVSLAVGQYPGTATNDNATAGNYGEYIESNIASGSALSLTTNTAKDVTTITLSAGDWDISGIVYLTSGSGTSFTSISGSVSTTLNTVDLTNGRVTEQNFPAQVPTANTPCYSLPITPVRFSVSGSTTIHLVALATFTVSVCSAYGLLRARRIR